MQTQNPPVNFEFVMVQLRDFLAANIHPEELATEGQRASTARDSLSVPRPVDEQ